MKRAQGSAELPLGVEYELRPLPKPVEILVGEVKQEINPRNERPMTVAIEDSYKPELMQDYAYFAPTGRCPWRASMFCLTTPSFQPIVDKIRQHGIIVEELTAPLADRGLELRRRGHHQIAQAVSGTQRSQAEGPVHNRKGNATRRHTHRPPRAAARPARRLPARTGKRRWPHELELHGSVAGSGKAGAGQEDHDNAAGARMLK